MVLLRHPSVEVLVSSAARIGSTAGEPFGYEPGGEESLCCHFIQSLIHCFTQIFPTAVRR